MEPDLDAIQATYDFELRAGNPAHERDLKLVKAKCLKGQDPSYICFVSFLSAADPDGRIYNNVTEIAYIGGGWLRKRSSETPRWSRCSSASVRTWH